MGLLEPKLEGNRAEKKIANELAKPWYKKPEAWFAFIAAVASIIAIFIK